MNKIPKNRPTYDMLLKDPWLKPLDPDCSTISEDDEGEEEGVGAATEGMRNLAVRATGEDPIVAEWVKGVLVRLGEGEGEAAAARPALHTAPLDGVSPGLGPLGGKSPLGGM